MKGPKTSMHFRTEGRTQVFCKCAKNQLCSILPTLMGLTGAGGRGGVWAGEHFVSPRALQGGSAAPSEGGHPETAPRSAGARCFTGDPSLASETGV